MMISALWCDLGKFSPYQNPLKSLIGLNLHMMDPALWISATTSKPFTQTFFGVHSIRASSLSLSHLSAALYSTISHNQSRRNEQRCEDCTITACPVKCYLHMTAWTLEVSVSEWQPGLCDGFCRIMSQGDIKLMCQEKFVVCLTGETERLLFTYIVRCYYLKLLRDSEDKNVIPSFQLYSKFTPHSIIRFAFEYNSAE